MVILGGSWLARTCRAVFLPAHPPTHPVTHDTFVFFLPLSPSLPLSRAFRAAAPAPSLPPARGHGSQIHEFVTLNPLPGKLPKKKGELFNSLRKLQVRKAGGLRVVCVCGFTGGAACFFSTRVRRGCVLSVCFA